MQPPPPRSEALAQQLLAAGALEEEQLVWAREALARERRGDPSATLGGVLLRAGLVSEERLAACGAALGLPAAGTRLGRYQLEEVLGQGAMGRVYLARDLKLERGVALKVLSGGADQRFQQEARALARLNHPHVVTLYDATLSEGLRCLAMEAIEGVDLTHHRRAQGRRAFLVALAQVADAVAHAHAEGITHRDLKPDNVLVDGGGRAFVTDFGVAAILDADLRLTRTGTMIGTPAYMPPEQCVGDLERMGPSADVWALGVILYEGLAEAPPFAGASFVQLVGEIASHDPPPPSPRGPGPAAPALDALCARALRKDPRERPSARAFADALRAELGAGPSRSPAPRPRAGALASLLALGLLAGALLTLGRPGLDRPGLGGQGLGGQGPESSAASPTPEPSAAPSPSASASPSQGELELARSANRLFNPGFELGQRGCEGWQLEGAQGTRRGPFSEFGAVELLPEGGRVRQPVDLGEHPWRRARLSGMVWAEAGGEAELRLSWEGPSPGAAAVRAELRPGRWTLVAGEVALPAATVTSAAFTARAAGARLDELSLEGLASPLLADGARLPQRHPIASAFRGLDGGQPELAAYGDFAQHVEYSREHARRLRRAFPARPVFKQHAFGAIGARDAQARVYPGHWLYARPIALRSGLPARPRFELQLAQPGAVQPYERGGGQRWPEATLVRAREGRPDLSRALHVRILRAEGRRVVCRALHHYPPGEPPLTFAAGEGLLLPHLPWGGPETWLLNLDPAGPRSPSGQRAHEVYVEHLSQQLEGLSGVWLDIPYWRADRLAAYPLDIDLDGVPDAGFRAGLNVQGLGQHLLLRRLRERLGPGVLIGLDGEQDKARSWRFQDGVQLERFLFRRGADDAARLARFGFQFDHLRNVVGRLATPRPISHALCFVDSARFRQPSEGLGLEEVAGEEVGRLAEVGLVSNLLLGLPHAYVERDRGWRPRPRLSDPFWPVPWEVYRQGGRLGWLGRPLEPLRVASEHLVAQVPIARWQMELAQAEGYRAAHPQRGGDPLRTHRVEVQQVPAGRPRARGVELRTTLPVRLSEGQGYTLVFEARGQSRYRAGGEELRGLPRALQVSGLAARGGGATLALVDERWRLYSLAFVAARSGPSELRFGLSEQVGWSELRKVRLLRGQASRYSRRYEGGQVALNLSGAPWTLDPREELEAVVGQVETAEGRLRLPAGAGVVLRPLRRKDLGD